MNSNRLRILLSVVTCALLGYPTAAQVSSRKTLNLEGAQKVIAAAETEARRSGGTAVIAVVDAGGNLMALQRLDGTFRCRRQHFHRQGPDCRSVQEADQSL